MNRRSIAVLIVAAWLGALSWLGWRELGAAGTSTPDESARTISPGAAYYVVSVGDHVIGYAANTVDTVPEGLQVDDRLILELPTATGLARTERRTLANLTNTLRIRDFETRVGSEDRRYVLRGNATDDSTLTLRLEGDESFGNAEVKISASTVLPEVLPLRLAFRNQLAAGDTILLSSLGEESLTPRPWRVYVAAESTLVFPDSAAWDSLNSVWTPARWDTLQAWRIETLGERPISMWVGGLGQIISSTYESGLTIQRTAFEIAFHNFRTRPDSGFTLINEGHAFGTAIAAGIGTLDAPRDEFRVRIGSAWKARDSLIDSRQSFVGDELLIQSSAVDVVDPTLRIPMAGTAELVTFMRPDVVTQSNDPRIQAQARLATEGTTRANRAAQRIARWVYENLEKRPDVGVPSALHVLESQGGGSYEHAILFVALARAVGLPARTVAGLLYVNDRFYYHNWAEVFLGRGWMAVDPMYGQQPADASHVRFVYGGQPGDFAMIRLIGNLRVDAADDEE